MSLNLAPNEANTVNQASFPVVGTVVGAVVGDSNYVRDPSQVAAEIRSSTDVLVQLRANLSQLEELHARLQFTMSEVSYLIRRD